MEQEGLLRVREAASRLGLREATLRTWMSSGRIEFVKIGRASRFKPETIEEVIRRGTVEAIDDGEKETRS
jgi:excisionase family DNA binding protein